MLQNSSYCSQVTFAVMTKTKMRKLSFNNQPSGHLILLVTDVNSSPGPNSRVKKKTFIEGPFLFKKYRIAKI